MKAENTAKQNGAKLRMLRLSPYFYPEQIASTHLTADLDEAFEAAGFETVVHCPTPTRGVDAETREKYKKLKYEELRGGGIKVHRFSMFREKKNPIQRALRYVLVNAVQYFRGRREKGIDVIMAGSTPPTQGLLCAGVKKKLGVPFVYNLQDIFPDSLVNTGLTKKGSLIWKIGRKIEDATYRAADVIIVISDDFKRNIMAKGVPEEKIAVIPNWVDTSAVYPIERSDNKLFETYADEGLDRGKFYVAYSGNIGHTQNLGMLLDTADALKDELPDLRFLLIGDGAAREETAARIERDGIGNVIMLPFQPYEDIAHVFSAADVGLIISKPGVGENSVPSKTWSIMAAERPILASFDADSQLCRVIGDAGCGVCVPAGDGKAFAEAIRLLYASRGGEEYAAMSRAGREYLRSNLDKASCTAAYVDAIRGACGKQGV